MKEYLLRIPDAPTDQPGIHIQETRDDGPFAIFIQPADVDFVHVMEACRRLEYARRQVPVSDATTQLVFDF